MALACRVKRYGDKMELLGQNEAQQAIAFQWLAQPAPIAEPPAPPKAITYQKPELPADLTESDWSMMLEVLELVKRTVPTNDERPPAEIFGVIKKALMEHFK